MHVLGVVVIWVVVSILENPVAIPPVSPVIPIFSFRGVVRVNNVSSQFGFQILAAFARLVPVDLLQLVRLQHVQLRLLLHVGGSQVLFGVVVSSEGAALSHKAGPTEDQQENQEQDSTYSPTDYSAQAAVRQGGQGWRAERGFMLVHCSTGSGCVVQEGCSGAGGGRGGGRICRVNM